MTTTADLIEELADAAASGRFMRVWLAVGFKKNTEFVYASDEAKLEKFNGLIRRGGEPIGFLGFVYPPAGTRVGAVVTRLLPEYAEEEWAADYLQALTASFCRAMESAGLGKVVPGDN